MLVDIYKSATDNNKYLTVAAGTDIATFQFPSDRDPDLLDIYPFKMNESFDPAEPRVGMNIPEILMDVQVNGFCAHRIVITTTIINS